MSQVLTTGGARLDDTVRRFMESRFNHDFSAVRIHSGPQPAASARSLDARAYTVGNDIVLGAGESVRGTSGRRLLAHELTHVIQQHAGRVAGTPGPNGLLISDPSDPFEREAEAAAQPFAAGTHPLPGHSEPTPARSRFLPRSSSGQRLVETGRTEIVARSISQRTAAPWLGITVQRGKKKNKKAPGQDAGPKKYTDYVDGVGILSRDGNGSYATWEMTGGRWHVNTRLGGRKHGPEIYHVTREDGGKKHYFFTGGQDDTSDATPETPQKGSMKFSALPGEVQRYVTKNLNLLIYRPKSEWDGEY